MFQYNAPDPQTNLILNDQMKPAFKTACTLYVDEMAKIWLLTSSLNQAALRKAVLDARDRRVSMMDQLWTNAQELAYLGNIPATRDQLAQLIQEYGRYQALEDVRFHGPIDPSATDTYARGKQVVNSQLLNYAGQLLQIFTKGERERLEALEQERREKEEPWKRLAHGQINQQTNWQQYAKELVRDQATYWKEDHQVAQQWAGVAKSTIDQAQQGVNYMWQGAGLVFDYAVKTQDNVIKMTDGIQKQVAENLPSYVEEAQVRSDQRRIGRKLKWFLIVGAVIVIGGLLTLCLVAQVAASLFPH